MVFHVQEGLHWSKVFTGRLSEDVKLVGSTISCETAYMGGKPGNEARHNAHVQSYVMATDQVLVCCTQLRSSLPQVFQCSTAVRPTNQHPAAATHASHDGARRDMPLCS